MKQDWFMWLCSIVLISLVLALGFYKKNFYAETNTVSSTVVNNTHQQQMHLFCPTQVLIFVKLVGWGIQNNVLGIATGVLIDDELCQLLKLSRSQYAFGMKVSAVALLCQDPRVWTSMMDAGTPCPVNGLIGAEAASYWSEHPHLIPDGSRYKPEYIAANKPEPKEFSDAQNAALFKTLFIFTTVSLF